MVSRLCGMTTDKGLYSSCSRFFLVFPLLLFFFNALSLVLGLLWRGVRTGKFRTELCQEGAKRRYHARGELGWNFIAGA